MRKHLNQELRAGVPAALRLRGHAVALLVETLELPRIHKRALVTLILSKRLNGLVTSACRP